MTLRQLCAANTVLLVLFVGIGWSVASLNGARVEVARSDGGVATAADVILDAVVIFAANVRVVALLALGACTLGILTMAVLAWNGYLLGFGLSALHRAQPGDFAQVLAYVPVEFGAFTLAAAASLHLALRVVRTLVAREPLAVGSSAAALMLSILLLAVAAGIESCVKVRLTHPL